MRPVFVQFAAAAKALALAVCEDKNNAKYGQREHIIKSSITHDV